MSAVLKELPKSWIAVPLEDCAEILDSRRIPLNSKERAARIDGKSKDELYPYYGATGQVDVIDDFLFEGEHLLIGEDGAPFFDKSKNVAYLAKGKFWVNNHAHILQALEGVTSNKYLLHYLNKFNYKGFVGGTTRLKLNQANLKQIPVPLAPPEQQKRIVAKIEELFSHIDAGIEALKKAKQLLKQYRQSVLKAAVTGELTKEWREANKDKLEPASKLLERILKERRQKWEEQQLEQFKAKGKTPKDDKWKEKYIEPEVPDASGLPILPDEWLWSGFEQVSSPEKNGMKAGPFGSALKKQYYVEKGYKIYGQEQVINNDPYYGDYYINEEKYQSLINCAVKPGDFLISLVGTVGRTLILPEDIEPGIINPRLIKITFDRSICLPEYAQIYVASPAAKQIFKLSSHGGTMEVLNMGTIKTLPLPLPPVSEQETIVELVKEKEDAIKRQFKYIDDQMLLIEKNKQSILASVFSGKL